MFLRFLPILFLIPLQAHSGGVQRPLNCECKGKDVRSRESCHAPPKGLVQERSAVVCPGPVPADNRPVEETADFATLLGYSGAKSKKDVLDYMSCYRSNDDQYCHFKNTLSPIIDYASKTSGIPYSVHACMVKQESGFQGQAKSSANAHGYVQFTQPALTTLNRVIHPARHLDEMRNAYEKSKQKLVAMGSGVLKERTPEAARLERQVRTQYAELKTREAWEKYWEGSKKPGQVTMASAGCQNIAFAMSSSLLVYEYYLLQDPSTDLEATSLRSFRSMNQTDTAILLTGAYNAGHGSVASHCDDSKTLQECIDAYPSGHETKKHMDSIRECAYAGHWSAMNYGKSRDCEDLKCPL